MLYLLCSRNRYLAVCTYFVTFSRSERSSINKLRWALHAENNIVLKMGIGNCQKCYRDEIVQHSPGHFLEVLRVQNGSSLLMVNPKKGKSQFFVFRPQLVSEEWSRELKSIFSISTLWYENLASVQKSDFFGKETKNIFKIYFCSFYDRKCSEFFFWTVIEKYKMQ